MEAGTEQVEALDRAEAVSPPEAGCGCSAASAPPSGSLPASYVYVLGRIEPRFPSLAVEKEFAQVSGRAAAAGLTDDETLHAVFADRGNRYLARQLCWVLVIGGLETYLLIPRDPSDIELLIEAIRPRPRPGDLDVVIGVRGPLASPQMCNGLVLPVVAFDQLYSFDRETLTGSIPRPEKLSQKDEALFRATADELLSRILQIADNAGDSDDHRALNYLAVRYPAIYEQTALAHADNASLSSVEVRPSRLSGARTVVEVIFGYTNRQTDVTQKFFVRVDVSEEFPFLVNKLSPFLQSH